MTAPVGRCTIHHEGAGTPTDVARGAAGGYSIWIGLTYYTVLRTPWISFATLGFNHVSLDICLSGDRMTNAVTDSDITLIRNAVAEARANGWVVDAPEIVAHRNSPGSSTVCPGDHTMARWADVVAACTKSKPHPAPSPVTKDETMLYPSRTPGPPNRFRGAEVNCADRTVFAHHGAVITPDPGVAPGQGVEWMGSYQRDDDAQGRTRFVIVTRGDDGSDFTFTVA